MEELTTTFSKMGFMVYIKNATSMILNYHYIDLDTSEFESDSITFTGTPDQIRVQFQNWYTDKDEWIVKDRVLYVQQWNNPNNFDLAEELEALGHINVEVENEDSNFPSVTFTKIDFSFAVKLETTVSFSEVGDKFILLQVIKEGLKVNKPKNK
jgi:hypothetical protein